MQAMKIDGKYRLLIDNDRLPKEVDQGKLDKCLASIKETAIALQTVVRSAYVNDDTSDDAGVIQSIMSDILSEASISHDDGRIWRLENLIYEVEELQELLEQNKDIIPSFEETATIFDYGFKDTRHGWGIYEKTLESSREIEVIEEVFLYNGVFRHRKRTTYWKEEPYGRSSERIEYLELPIDDDLMQILNNSKDIMKNITD